MTAPLLAVCRRGDSSSRRWLSYAYGRIGGGFRRPLLCLQHFTGTLDNWDPSVTDPLGDGREVILFDSAGVGRPTGKVPTTVAEMSAHALQFLDGLCVASCDVLGFSLGGMVAQQMALERPSSIRRMILSAPRGGEDIAVMSLARCPNTDAEEYRATHSK